MRRSFSLLRMLLTGSAVLLSVTPAAAFASSTTTTTTTTSAQLPATTTIIGRSRRSGSRQRPYANALASLRHSSTLQSSQHMRQHASPSSLRSVDSTTALHMMIPRGGASLLSSLASDPQTLFNANLIGLASLTAVAKIGQKIRQRTQNADSATAGNRVEKPDSIKSLQARFLAVFWLLRCSDWLQGPYFYEVYASKVFDGVPASMRLVSQLFLTGFASTAIFGPWAGRAADNYGRKKATLAFCVIYAAGALSTKSPLLAVLLAGRVLSGIGTSLLFSAPESWLVGEAQRGGDDPDGKHLGETFGLAYAGDSIVAILAGQMAGWVASAKGPTGPFELSAGFLLAGGLLAGLLWQENRAGGAAVTTSNSSSSDKDNAEKESSSSKSSFGEAVQMVLDDPKIMLVGAVQSLFEAAMYIFVLQWPPAVSAAIGQAFGGAAATPYGTIFSCFMACCLLGSTLFGQLSRMSVRTESSTAGMLSVATVAMSAATWIVAQGTQTHLAGVVAAFFAFEACVGMYFPSIGTLRSKYVPDSHRSLIMNLFGIPLNVLVVSVFLSIDKLGVVGALSISSGALGVAAACMLRLLKITGNKAEKEAAPSPLESS